MTTCGFRTLLVVDGLRSNFGSGRADIPVNVTFTPTRARVTPPYYYTNITGDATGSDLSSGPRSTYPDVFTCLNATVTVPHHEIVCIVPQGYGGQLEWTVTVLERQAPAFRYDVRLVSCVRGIFARWRASAFSFL